MKPKVSIVVPVYKVPEKYLRNCIESIIRQTLNDIEVLLVDDGSPDQCGEICDDYAIKDARIKVIHKKNGGLSSARNAGFKEASAKWIMFVDGDDWIDSEMCQSMYEVGEQNDVQLVMCGMCKEYGHTSTPYRYYLEDGKVYRDSECKWLQEQLLHFDGNIATAYCKLIDRALLENNNILHDEVLRQGAEGLEFNLRLFEVIHSAIFINRSFYHYIYNDQSISAAPTEENNQYVLECFKKIEKFINCSENKEKLAQWFDNRLLYVIVTTAISGYFNPNNVENYNKRKKDFIRYLNNPLVVAALKTKNKEGIGRARSIVLFLCKYKCFIALELLGKIRKRQKLSK